MLVIRSRPAAQPAAGDSAVAQPTTTLLASLVRALELIGDIPARDLPHRRHTARSIACRTVSLFAPGSLDSIQPPVSEE
jgi:hypothetical protein